MNKTGDGSDKGMLFSGCQNKRSDFRLFIYYLFVHFIQVLICPNETTKVFNQVSASSSLDYIVAVADTNVVCIWKRLTIEHSH